MKMKRDLLKTLNIDESIQQIVPPDLKNLTVSSKKQPDSPGPTASYFARKSRMTGRTAKNESLKNSALGVELESLRSIHKSLKSENYIETCPQTEKKICFGDKLILFFQHCEIESGKKKTLVMFGEGIVTNNVMFQEVSASYCSKSVQTALFEIVDLKNNENESDEIDFELKWEDVPQDSMNFRLKENIALEKARTVFYGEGFLLQHCQSRKFLTITSFANSEGANGLRFVLKEPNSDFTPFKFCSANKLAEIGTHVGYNDILLLRNQRQNSHLAVHENSDQNHNEHYLVNDELRETNWQAYLFRRTTENSPEEADSVKDGDIVQIYDPINEAYLCCDILNAADGKERVTLNYPQPNDLVQNHTVDVTCIQNAFFRGFEIGYRKDSAKSVHSLWEIKTSLFGCNESVSYNENINLKHIGSGGILRYNFNESKFYLEDPCSNRDSSFSLISEHDPTSSLKVNLEHKINIKSDEYWLAYKDSDFKNNELFRRVSESAVSDQSEQEINSSPRNSQPITLSPVSQIGRTVCYLKKNPSLTAITLTLFQANHFFLQSHQLFLVWDMGCRMGSYEYDMQTAIKNRHSFVERVEAFVDTMAWLSKLCLDYQSQSENFQLDFHSLETDFTEFENAIVEIGLVETLVEIICLLINKTYSISLKLLNMHSEKTQDNDDFMTYKRLAISLAKSHKSNQPTTFKEMDNYLRITKSILRFLSLLVDVHPKFGAIILKKSEFIIKLHHFCEEEIIELVNKLLKMSSAEDSLLSLAVLFFKHVFCAEDHSTFMIKMMNFPQLFPNLLARLSQLKYPELPKILYAHMFFVKPFVSFAASDGSDSDRDAPQRGFDNESDLNRSGEELEFEVQLSLTEGGLISRVQQIDQIQ